MSAVHSIAYRELPAHFFLFAIWDTSTQVGRPFTSGPRRPELSYTTVIAWTWHIQARALTPPPKSESIIRSCEPLQGAPEWDGFHGSRALVLRGSSTIPQCTTGVAVLGCRGGLGSALGTAHGACRRQMCAVASKTPPRGADLICEPCCPTNGLSGAVQQAFLEARPHMQFVMM